MKDTNLPYSFNDDERKVQFSRSDLSAPWINYLSNGRLHAFVSQAGGVCAGGAHRRITGLQDTVFIICP